MLKICNPSIFWHDMPKTCFNWLEIMIACYINYPIQYWIYRWVTFKSSNDVILHLKSILNGIRLEEVLQYSITLSDCVQSTQDQTYIYIMTAVWNC